MNAYIGSGYESTTVYPNIPPFESEDNVMVIDMPGKHVNIKALTTAGFIIDYLTFIFFFKHSKISSLFMFVMSSQKKIVRGTDWLKSLQKSSIYSIKALFSPKIA